MTAPWSLGLSTQVYNPSYVLFGAVAFFVAAIETYPFLSLGIIPRWASNLMMGFAIAWIMQFHLSWVVLLPYVALSFYFQIRHGGKRFFVDLGWFLLAFIVPASVLIPTFWKYGLSAGLGNTNEAVGMTVENFLRTLNIVEGVLGRFLSFASYELPRFMGRNTAERLSFVKEHLWLAPFVIFLTITGILQSIALLLLWFRDKGQVADWRAMKYFTLGTVLLLYASFFFSIKSPASHTIYVAYPVATLYSFYCWNRLLRKKGWRTLAWVVIVSGIVFQAGLAAHNCKRTSIYVDRDRIQEAIDRRDFRILGERREGSKY